MKIVIALGGNALGSTPEEQKKLVKTTANHIADLIQQGHDVVITHGNGPQVGMINLATEEAHKTVNTPAIPFPECGAMSQGYIGYHLQNAIEEELNKRNINKNCASIITQVLVDKNDEAFSNPTKPIGSFYTKEEAKNLEATQNITFKEDAGRGYRRVIASPKPLKIIELNVIKDMIDKGNVVIACGGGGIPVIEENGLQGIDAVIDKDKTSAKLAEDLNADLLIILTAVDKVAINYGKENQTNLNILTTDDANKYIEKNEFAPGSILPKIEACLDFVNSTNKTAIITSLDKAKEAINGNSGTIIIKEN